MADLVRLSRFALSAALASTREDRPDARQGHRRQPRRDHAGRPSRPRRPARHQRRSTLFPGDRTSAPPTAGPSSAPTCASCRRAQFYDYVRNRAVAGNPYLSQTYVHNADLRWELFPSGAEVLAASGFYKYFEHPIERVIAGAGDVNFENADNAHAAGIELEARFNGGRIRPRLEPLYLGANFTYTYSRVKETAMDGQVTYRALQGQSPYVVNAEIGYRRGGTQLLSSTTCSAEGSRRSEQAEAGDVYEEAFNRLDITLNQRLPRGLTFKVSGTNLLNQRIVFRQGDKADSGGGPAILRVPARRRRLGGLGMVLRRSEQVSKQGDRQ